MSKLLFLYSILLCFLFSCNRTDSFNYKDRTKLRFEKENNRWILYRDNKPYYVSGIHGSSNLELAKQIGANSILMYENELSDSILRVADSLGFTVSVSLNLWKARQKENSYTDTVFTNKQRKRIGEVVRKYCTYECVLFWILGNEINIMNVHNVPEIWKEVNEISKLIHSIDSIHPTTTALAAYPSSSYEPLKVKMFASDLDFLSLNIYEYAPILKRETENFLWGFDKPFLVTEWSGMPYWNLPKTEWGAIIEPTSTKNADYYSYNYQLIFQQNYEKCLGGYVFYWGQKQERTHTLFSMLHESKYKKQVLEYLHFYWLGSFPENWCPRITDFSLKGISTDNIYLEEATEYTAILKTEDPDKDTLRMSWELREEGRYLNKVGGEFEMTPAIILKSDSLQAIDSVISFVTPKKQGAYRLFVYVFDNRNYVATANIPFYVLK
ncbi:MAG: hypothetical protein IPO21_21090 [Bacteroidales bacterium]|nr:hypothetical protein [Bacteroidales bacterium]